MNEMLNVEVRLHNNKYYLYITNIKICTYIQFLHKFKQLGTVFKCIYTLCYIYVHIYTLEYKYIYVCVHINNHNLSSK